MESHICTIGRMIVGEQGWRVHCPTCGNVGTLFDLLPDAEAVKVRHEEVEGFG